MPTPKPEELDARAFKGRWCEHCRCQVIAERVTATGNHKSCGKATEFLPLIVHPVRDFAST